MMTNPIPRRHALSATGRKKYPVEYSDVNAVMKNTGISMVQGIFFPNTCMEK